MIKAVLIDVDNTLLDFNMCSLKAMEDTYKEFSLTFTDAVFPTFKRINDMLWIKIEKKQLTKAELHNIRWQLIFEALGETGADGVAFEQRFYAILQKTAYPVTGAVELLQYLAPKYTVCAASNASRNQQIERLTSAGMLRYMKNVYTSEEIGCPKPGKDFFSYCLNDLGVSSPSDAMMIGDSLSADIYGAIDFGIKTCWFNFFKEHVPKDLKSDHIVYSLDEIKDIL